MSNYLGAYPLQFAKDVPTGGRKPTRTRCLDYGCDALLTFDVAKRQSGYCTVHLKDYAAKLQRIYGGAT